MNRWPMPLLEMADKRLDKLLCSVFKNAILIQFISFLYILIERGMAHV